MVVEGVVTYRPDPVGVVGGPCSHGSLRGLADVPETHSTVVTGGSKLVLLVRVEINRPGWKMCALYHEVYICGGGGNVPGSVEGLRGAALGSRGKSSSVVREKKL